MVEIRLPQITCYRLDCRRTGPRHLHIHGLYRYNSRRRAKPLTVLRPTKRRSAKIKLLNTNILSHILTETRTGTASEQIRHETCVGPRGANWQASSQYTYRWECQPRRCLGPQRHHRPSIVLSWQVGTAKMDQVALYRVNSTIALVVAAHACLWTPARVPGLPGKVYLRSEKRRGGQSEQGIF